MSPPVGYSHIDVPSSDRLPRIIVETLEDTVPEMVSNASVKVKKPFPPCSTFPMTLAPPYAVVAMMIAPRADPNLFRMIDSPRRRDAMRPQISMPMIRHAMKENITVSSASVIGTTMSKKLTTGFLMFEYSLRKIVSCSSHRLAILIMFPEVTDTQDMIEQSPSPFDR